MAHLWTELPRIGFRHPPVASVLHLHEKTWSLIMRSWGKIGDHVLIILVLMSHEDKHPPPPWKTWSWGHEEKLETLYLSSAPPQTNIRWNWALGAISIKIRILSEKWCFPQPVVGAGEEVLVVGVGQGRLYVLEGWNLKWELRGKLRGVPKDDCDKSDEEVKMVSDLGDGRPVERLWCRREVFMAPLELIWTSIVRSDRI